MAREKNDSDAERLMQQLLEQTGMSTAELAQTLLSGQLNDAFGLPRFGPPQPRKVTIPRPPKQPVVIRLRIDLDGSKPRVWRRLEVRGELTAADLHEVVQTAMGWTNSHLHRFWLGPKKEIWTGPHLVNDLDEDEYGDDPGVADEDDVRVDQLLRAAKDRLFYTYDFGDNWHHTITVEEVRPATDDDPPARCLTGKMACPLEDCGGIGGHEEILELLAGGPDRSDWPEHLAHWVPPGWDPREFDAATVNTLLQYADPLLLGAAHPAVGAFLQRLGPAYLQSLSPVIGSASLPAPVSDDEMREAVRFWQLFLTLAGTDGIPLTQAGYLSPQVVERISQETGITGWWIGKANREDLTPPAANLRDGVMRAGLLRKVKGKLLRTPTGRRVDGRPRLLWEHLTSTGLEFEARTPADEFVADASVATLLQVAAGCPAREATARVVADSLNEAGWAFASGPVSGFAAEQAARDLVDVLNWIEGTTRAHGIPVEPTPTQRAFAREALDLAD